MIIIKNLCKYFGHLKAIDDVSLRINKGEIVGFLGRNGAGKTTFMRMLTTYYQQTSGSISIFGFDSLKKSMDIRRIVGYLPETPPLYMSMTVRSYLKFAGQLRELSRGQLIDSLKKVLEQCHLEDVQHKLIGQLSKGYKQRVGIAQALMHNPHVLILDEPTSGLDPIQVRHVQGVIDDLRKDRIVILSTHILSEIENLVDRVVMMGQGKIILDQKILRENEAGPDKNLSPLEKQFFKLNDDFIDTD